MIHCIGKISAEIQEGLAGVQYQHQQHLASLMENQKVESEQRNVAETEATMKQKAMITEMSKAMMSDVKKLIAEALSPSQNPVPQTKPPPTDPLPVPETVVTDHSSVQGSLDQEDLEPEAPTMVNGKVPGKQMTLADAQAATWKAKNYHRDRTPTGFKMTPSSHPKNDRLWDHHISSSGIRHAAQDVPEHMLRRKNVQVTTVAGAGGHDSPSHSHPQHQCHLSPSICKSHHPWFCQSHTMGTERWQSQQQYHHHQDSTPSSPSHYHKVDQHRHPHHQTLMTPTMFPAGGSLSPGTLSSLKVKHRTSWRSSDTWDGKVKTFSKFKSLYESWLMMTGQSYVLDPEIRKAYDGTYESIQLLLDPMVMHKQQFEHDRHAQYGVLMMATQESCRGSNIYSGK